TMFGIAPSLQRAILLYGKAKTGKTQALEVLRAMMPENAVCSLPPHQWAARFALTSMVGKTLNLCGELPERGTIDGAVFKEVVEGLTQETEFKGKDRFQFKPQCANWFASNHLPRSYDTSAGFTRRWLILEFNKVVTDSERIMNFHEILVSEEREAIAAWAVEGLSRVLKQGDYTLPASHKLAINQVRRANNSVEAFLQSNEKIRPVDSYDESVDARTAFDAYVWYMKDVSRGWGVTYETFLHMIRELGYATTEERDVTGVMRYRIHNMKAVVPVLV
ncbi:MAG: phage/plasmid primase, P4 family, partial [Sphingomonas sp.]|uniref:phage/plasmid primase, P4 family n=1 Tax=Sphingomonas sp. TaxID=28214 RepID=UPI003F7E43A8